MKCFMFAAFAVLALVASVPLHVGQAVAPLTDRTTLALQERLLGSSTVLTFQNNSNGTSNTGFIGVVR